MPKHKLVVIGDSISQGFNNGGIYRTDINFPAFLHRALDPNSEFSQPRFTAQAGIPINLEVLLRGVSDQFGDTIEWNEYLPIAKHAISTLKRVKKYWEGGLKDLSVSQLTPFHNQSVWGFALNDSWLVNEKNAEEFIRSVKDTYSIFSMLPDHAMYTTSRLVLNPTLENEFSEYTQFDNAKILSDDGGIENLIVCLGHNNIVRAITHLECIWSEESDLESFPSERKYTVARPEHFELQYRKLAEKISKLNAKRVFVPTIPYVTIPPASRGVNHDKDKKPYGYFDYYTRFWIWDDDFNPEKHPHLTKAEAITLDLTVDKYNSIIRKVAREYGWNVVPVAKSVSNMARRRTGDNDSRRFPPRFLEALKENPNTSYLLKETGEITISTEYLRLDKENYQIIKGGIFSLDGLHPTTIGYGLMANIYYDVMKKAGVKFEYELDWHHIIDEDSLITYPPILLSELRLVLRYLSMGRQERFLNVGKSVLGQLLNSFSANRS